MIFRVRIRAAIALVALVLSPGAPAQKQTASRHETSTPDQSASELSKLRDQYIKTTKDYKANLQKLLALYQDSAQKAAQQRDKMQKLLAEGLVSQREVEQAESALTDAGLKVSEVQQQLGAADTQIAQTPLEIEGEKQLAKLGPLRKGALVRTTSFIRYNGAGAWSLSQAGKIELFF